MTDKANKPAAEATAALTVYELVLTGQLTVAEAREAGDAAFREASRKGERFREKTQRLQTCPECGNPVKQTTTGRGRTLERHPECKAFRKALNDATRALDTLRAANSEECGCDGDGPRCFPGTCPTPRRLMSWHQAKNTRSELWSLANSLNPLCKGVDNESR